MKRQTLKRWAGLCVLGSVLGAAGCDQGLLGAFTSSSASAAPCAHCRHYSGPCATAHVGRDGERLAPASVTQVAYGRALGPVMGMSAGAAHRASAPPATGITQAYYVPSSQPTLTLDASAREEAAPAARPTSADANTAIEQVAGRAIGREESFHDRDTTQNRRAFVDLTVQPWFSHADDHSWLKGQVLYSRTTNTWRLHYASVDDADPYGGTVTLTGSERLKDLKDGQCVRVEGHLADSDRREADSAYQVSAFEILDKP